MNDVVDASVYIRYMVTRWRLVAFTCLVALAIAAIVSVAARREYTATARLFIETPAGADARAAMAVSPIYLESLKTYEQFAASDSLFQNAAGRFQLQKLTGTQPIETLKKRVLRVGIVRNTRILEISATLPDPRKAQALAQYIAEQTVSLNRSLAGQGTEELLAGIEKQAATARAQLERDDAALARLRSDEPVEPLQSSIDDFSALRSKLLEQAADTRVEIADAGEREKQAPSAEADLVRKEKSNAAVRLGDVEKQLADLDRDIAEKEKLLGGREARREELEASLKADQDGLAALETRLRDARNDLPYLGERLTIVDPGVVPERPSSPNIQLNLLAAALLGILFPLFYLALALNVRQSRDVGQAFRPAAGLLPGERRRYSYDREP
jgi:uncharacterized protein involved in exopolysaccharide biosynthesis